MSKIPRLFKLIIDSSDAIHVSSEAIKTTRLITSSIDVSDSTDLIELIARLIENMHAAPENNLVATTEVYQLLSQLYAEHPAIIKQLPNEVIEKSIHTDTLSFKLTDSNLSMQIYRIQWIFVYTKDDSEGKLTQLLNMKQVHNILANGLKSCNEGLIAFSLVIARPSDT